MADCPASDPSGTGKKKKKKLTIPEQGLHRTKLMLSGIFWVRYQNKIMNAGIPMPALVSSKPMPSYSYGSVRRVQFCAVGQCAESLTTECRIRQTFFKILLHPLRRIGRRCKAYNIHAWNLSQLGKK
jgi:hypothetical protein